MFKKYEHMIRVDSDDNIVDGYSTADTSKKVLPTDIMIRQGGNQFFLFVGGPRNPRFTDEDGIYLYRWNGARVLTKSKAELDKDRRESPALVRESAIMTTKAMLSDALETPITVQDGNYSVTMEKQQLLATQLAMFMMNSQAGIPYELKWNQTGQECMPWTFEQMIVLANVIDSYVKPLVSAQRSAEMALIQATTRDEIQDVMESYQVELAETATEMRKIIAGPP